MRKRTRLIAAAGLAASLSLIAAGCPQSNGGGDVPTGEAKDVLSGEIIVDGSSTVFPVSEAMAEEFGIANPDVRVTVGTSGTGGGFKKFCNGESDISNASRPIKDEERKMCEDKGIEFTELSVAFDGLTVVANPENEALTCLTVDQLNKAWEPNSVVSDWTHIDPDLPAGEIEFYGPGPDSGTFDYFTEVINGESGATRSDFQASEDDNVLVQGVAGDKSGFGYFGFAYYTENKDKLKAVAVDGGAGCVLPSVETIRSGEYTPLSRPLFIYVRNDALLERPEVEAFVRYHLEEGEFLIPDVGYVPLEDYPAELEKLDEALN